MVSWADFREWMKAEYRPITCTHYWSCCRRFIEWARIKSPQELGTVSPSLFLEYDRELKNNGVGSRQQHGFALRSMLAYFGYNDLVGKVPARRETVQKPPKWLPKPVIDVMVEHAPDERMKALTSLSYDLALRIREALMFNITPKPGTVYIDLRKGQANIYREKTKLYPWLLTQVSNETMERIRGYMKVRNKTSDALFTSTPYFEGGKGGGRLSVFHAEHLWHKWMGQLKMDPYTWNFKMLRHSKLTWMHVQGKDLVEIAKFAGHSTPNPTMIYLHLASQWEHNPEMFLTDIKGSVIYAEAKQALGI